jgi:Transmembrane domain of unknown function (DUF3566)
MTANTGKGADGKRPTGADGKSGKPRKKASAANRRSDEVTVRTNDTNGAAPEDDSEDTVVDVPVAGKKDARPPAAEDDDATVTDAAPGSSSSSAEDESGRTATFGLPKDLGDGGERPGSSTSENDGSTPDTGPTETSERNEITKFPQESGDSMPNSGRSAAMDAPQPPSGGYGSTARGGATSANTPPGGRPPLGSGTPPYAPGGPGTPGRLGGELTSRVAKLAGALRKPEARPSDRKPPRKAHLQVARFEPWSVMKFSFIMSLVCFLVLFVAVAVLYVILSWLGVFDALSNTIHDLTSNDQGKSGSLNPASWFSAARILGYTALIGTLNVLLITALATVWSVIYNMAADLVGGVEVTLKEADQ